MKICFLSYDLGGGGAERTISYLADYAVKQGHEVDVVVKVDVKSYDMDERVNYIPLKYKKFKPGKFILKKAFNTVANFINTKMAFNKYVKENKPDLICCLLYGTSLYALSWRKKIPIVASERSNPKWIKSKFKKVVRKFIVKKVDGMIFQTERAKSFYTNNVASNARYDSVVIANAVGNNFAYTVNYDHKNAKKKISAVGRLVKEKDYGTLLQAFSLFLQKHDDFILEIYGVGAEENNLKQIAKDLNLENKVEFKGFAKNALQQISDSMCYVMSSISEGMPNSLMEAMAIGMPCVSTDCDNGPSELIVNNESGIIVPIKDAKAMCEAITKMVEDRDFALKCGNNASKIKETNSIEEISKKYLEFFEKIAQKRNRK